MQILENCMQLHSGMLTTLLVAQTKTNTLFLLHKVILMKVQCSVTL